MKWQYRVLYDDDHWGVYEVLFDDLGRVRRRSKHPVRMVAGQSGDLRGFIIELQVAHAEPHLKLSDVDAAIRGTGPQVFTFDNEAERERLERQRERET